MKTTINYLSGMLCALLLCVGLMFAGCTEGPLGDDQNTEQGGNDNNGGENGGQETPESEAVDISKAGTANSYVVSTAGSYKFTPTKGNSNTSVGSVASVAVLWESFGTYVTPNVGDLVKEIKYENGVIKFKTADTFKEGNAVIAAKDASGNILWSWHIWLTDQPEGQVYYNNAGTMMDRNLGATSATPGDIGAHGLLYQWGRKDPFLCAMSAQTSIDAESTLAWPSAVTSDSSTGKIEYAILHPTTFIAQNNKNYDWYYTGSQDTDITRWTESSSPKSIYDPCPAGWRVPDGGFNGVWAKALGSSSSFSGYPVDSTNYGINFSGALGSASAIWYPTSGHRSPKDGDLSGTQSYGYYWSASHSGLKSAHMFFFNGGDIDSLANVADCAEGCSVRCIKE